VHRLYHTRDRQLRPTEKEGLAQPVARLPREIAVDSNGGLGRACRRCRNL
jgi:hypothetical protein